MKDEFIQELLKAHSECRQCPKSEDITLFFNDLLGLLFPNFSNEAIGDRHVLHRGFARLELKLAQLLDNQPTIDPKMVVTQFFQGIPSIYQLLHEDVQAIYNWDPAAKSHQEIIRSYPGFYAIASYRVAHELLELGVQIIPRGITENAHSRTGIDIHPGAQIGRHFFIDHGTGVVIGETTVIGDHVKIYQGVTLGALSVDKEAANRKRHPTIENHVVIYSGATILGGETVIGEGSVIGGNVWLTRSVPAGTKVYYQTRVKEGDTENLITIKN